MVESEFCFCVRSQVPPQTPDLNLNVKGPVTCNFALLLVSNVILIAFDKEKGATRHRHRRRQHDRTEYTPLVTRWLSPCLPQPLRPAGVKPGELRPGLINMYNEIVKTSYKGVNGIETAGIGIPRCGMGRGTRDLHTAHWCITTQERSGCKSLGFLISFSLASFCSSRALVCK